MAELLLVNVRPMGNGASDILIRDGKIAGVGDYGDHQAPREDGTGAIALPGFVEGHTHLDKTLLGMGWRDHQAGKSLDEKISTERRLRHDWDMDPARQSARLVRLCAAKGTTAIRSHVDIDTEHGLKSFHGVSATREHFSARMDVEIVAFPQSGLTVRPGTLELMDAALSEGADIVGGLDPCGIDRDPKGHLDAVFSLAQKHGKPIDIHLHEPDELGAFSLEMIIERTRATGMQGKVTVSHAFCLGMADRARARKLIDAVRETDIAIVTTAPASRPVPLASDMRDAGIRFGAGSDGVRDTWQPYGTADMLERAFLLGMRNDFRKDDDIGYALQVCTRGGADVLGLEGYGLREGDRADIVLVQAETLSEAVVTRPVRQLVLKRGIAVARNGEALFDVE